MDKLTMQHPAALPPCDTKKEIKIMDNPCKSCSRQGDCDHFFRCKRWRDWFTNQWQTIKELFSM